MKADIIITLAVLPVLMSFSPGKVEDYGFKTVKANPVTSIKDQYHSGTCWCFAMTSFFESEAIRIGGITEPALYPDFSEMFTVASSYRDRFVKYIRLNGALRSGPGSITADALHVVRDYGIVPETAMPCKTEKPELFEMDKKLSAELKAILNDKSALDTDWMSRLDRIMDRYMNPRPETFTVGGQTFTPESYRDAMGIDPDNYLTFTSFTHHPFYTAFALEVPDNWRWDYVWNIPVDELVTLVRTALENGYTVAWGSDISEPGYTEDGLMVIPEKTVSQEWRQHCFDIQETVDDHAMHIFGIAEDKNGEPYFIVKNSSGPDWGNPYTYWYVSMPYFKAKTIYLTVHREAVPSSIVWKLGQSSSGLGC